MASNRVIAGGALALAVLLMGASPGFRGCGEGAVDVGPDGVPLPTGMTACATDDDCGAGSCALFRCILNQCVEVASVVDVDGDGHAQTPCGDDCDDSIDVVYGGAPEMCDGADNDCDTTVDEGAPRLDDMYTLGLGDAQSQVVPWGDDLLVTYATRSAIWGIPIAVTGAAGAPLELLRLSMGSMFTRRAVVARDDGRVLLVAATDTGVTHRIVVERAVSGEVIVVEDPTVITAPSDLTALEIIPFAGTWAIGFEGRTPTGLERVVTIDPAVDPAISFAVDEFSYAPFALATDGTHLVLTDPAAVVRFFLPDGTEVVTHPYDPLRSIAIPIASGSGAIVTITSGGFDFNLSYLDVSGPGPLVPAPFGAAGDEVGVITVADLVLVERMGAGGVVVFPLQNDLSTREGSALPLGPSGATPRMSAAESGRGIGVLAAAGPMVYLGVLAGCSR